MNIVAKIKVTDLDMQSNLRISSGDEGGRVCGEKGVNGFCLKQNIGSRK